MTKNERLMQLVSKEMRAELDSGKTVEINYSYGESVVLTYNRKRICSRSGANYDKLGAAFSDIVTYIDFDALRNVFYANLPEFKECLYTRDGEMRVNGAIGMRTMTSLMKAMGYAVDYNSWNTRSGNRNGIILIKKI